MAHIPPKITFDPRQLKLGAEWCIVAKYLRGQKEHIAGFHSEDEALDWLAGDACQSWLRARDYAE